MSQENTITGKATYIVEEPKSNFPSSISSLFGIKSPTSPPNPPSSQVNDNQSPSSDQNGSTVQGDVSFIPFYQKFSQNIKSYKFLQTKLIIDIVNQLKELRLPLTEPYGIDIPSNLINPISQNETNIENVIFTIKSKTDERLKKINETLGEYGFNFVPSMPTIDDKLKTEIANEIEVVNKTLDLKFKNVFVKNVNEIRTETSKLYKAFLNDTLKLDNVNSPQYYESVIKIAKTFIERKLKDNSYLKKENTITDEQLDVLLKLNGVQFGAYFSNINNTNIQIPEHHIYIGEGNETVQIYGESKSYLKKMIGLKRTTNESKKKYWFMNQDGIIQDIFIDTKEGIKKNDQPILYEINYNNQSFSMHRTKSNGGRFTRRNLKSNKITKNKRSNRRKTHKLSN
jgi:hypothetical protein